ncbi:MAG TPA: hypothetical protein VGB83_08995 [Actinomycetota bacterium]
MSNRVTFASSLLDEPGGAEREDDPAARALAEFLATQEGVEPVFKTGYRVAARAPDEVTYVAGSGLELNVVTMKLEDGRWDYASSGDCQPEIVHQVRRFRSCFSKLLLKTRRTDQT